MSGSFQTAAGFNITVRVDSLDKVERVLASLSGGGVIGIPMLVIFRRPGSAS